MCCRLLRCVTFRKRLPRAEGHVLQTRGVGESGFLGAGGLLSGNQGGLLEEEPSPILQRPREGSGVSLTGGLDTRMIMALAQVPPQGTLSLLFIWGDVPRLSGCPFGAASGRDLWPIPIS